MSLKVLGRVVTHIFLFNYCCFFSGKKYNFIKLYFFPENLTSSRFRLCPFNGQTVISKFTRFQYLSHQQAANIVNLDFFARVLFKENNTYAKFCKVLRK